MKQEKKQIEVLTLQRGDTVATIATDGHRHVSQYGTTAKEHETLKRAIAFLYSRGFILTVDNWRSMEL